MSIILDLLVVAIIVVSIVISAKRGFARTIIEVAGFVAAFVIAFSLSSPLANITYDKAIKPSIVSSATADERISNTDAADKLWNSLPDIVRDYAPGLGLTKEKFNAEAAKVSGSTSQMIEQVADKTVKPAAAKILSIIYSTVIVVILLIVSKFIARAVNKLVSFSFVGTLNRFLGGVVGVFKGAAFAVIICMIISVIVVFSKGGFGIFTPDNINSTVLFKHFYGISPFI